MTLDKIAAKIKDFSQNIILLYAFNATGKTLLSVKYKELNRTKSKEKDVKGAQTGIYYNAFSEDLFIWDNDIENDETDIKLEIKFSSLNAYHTFIDESKVMETLVPFNPKYRFRFNPVVKKNDKGEAVEEQPELGYGSVTFYLAKDKTRTPIKISRGEEHIFVFCFFMTLASVEDWNGIEGKYIYIDDPVSSLDDNNIYITASILLNLIKQNYKNKKIIISTHHMGLLSILDNKLRGGQWIPNTPKKKEDSKGDVICKYEYEYIIRFLEKSNDDKYKLVGKSNGIRLHHLLLLDILTKAKKNKNIYPYHFALLRQLLENINSFIGKQGFNYVLKEIGRVNPNEDSDIINSIVHERDYTLKISELESSQKDLLEDIVYKLTTKFSFSI